MSELLNKKIPELPAIDTDDITDDVLIIIDDGTVTWSGTFAQLKEKIGVSTPVFFSAKITAPTPIDGEQIVLFNYFPFYSTLPVFNSAGKITIATDGKYRINAGVFFTDGWKPTLRVMKDSSDQFGELIELGQALDNKIETIGRFQEGSRIYIATYDSDGKTFQAGEFVENCYLIVEKIGDY